MNKNIEYIDKVITSVYQGIDMELIGYGYDCESPIRIYRSDTDLFGKERNIREDEVRVVDYKGTMIPLLFSDASGPVIEQHSDHVRVGFDLYAATFYLLTGWQEYVTSEKDEYGRFKYTDSFQYKYDCAMLPVVNYYLEMLMDAVEQANFSRPSIKTSEGAPFTFYLSHDIDECRSGWKPALKNELLAGRLGNVLRIVVDKLMGKDPWWSFDSIMSGERKEGVYSTYYFLTSRLLKDNIPHADYDIGSPRIKRLIQNLTNQGDQIGLHGSFGTSQSKDELRKEQDILFRDGIRFHFLGWSQRDTPQILNDLQFAHDSTLGFAEHIGFRNSFCHPFPLYDIRNQKILSVIEYPLNIMDTTLYNIKYMGVAPSDVIERIEPLIRQIEKFQGHLTILWHNNYFSEYKYNGWAKIYWEIIQLLKQRQGKCLLPKVNIG